MSNTDPATQTGFGSDDRDQAQEFTPAHKLGSYLIEGALDRSRGRDKPYCSGNFPNDQYHISNIAPEHGLFEEDEFESKTRPSSISLECKPTDSEDAIPLGISFDVYYPGVPTYEEYQELFQRSLRAARLEAVDRTENDVSPDDIPAKELNEDTLYGLDKRFFRRVQIQYRTELSLTELDSEPNRITAELDEALHDAVAASLEEYRGAAVSLKVDPIVEQASTTPLSEEEFKDRCSRRASLQPSDVELDIQLVISEKGDELSLSLANYSPDGQTADDYDGIFERFVFNPKLVAIGSFDPYQFELVPEDFRYDQRVWAKGRNCSTTSEQVGGGRRKLETKAVPSTPVYEFVFNTDYETGFDQLSRGATTETLEAISDGMEGYLQEWRGERRGKIRAELDLTDSELQEYDEASEDFAAEIERYQHGVELLKDDEMALKAFRLMNEVNERQHDFPGWRLFQLVYIVSNLSSIVRRERPELAQPQDKAAGVLWFPTGGGKTEAYLGLILFNLFYDRLRGKQQGVTAWIRFPLRLLSRQQKNRFLESLMYAEEIRRDSGDFGLDNAGDEFSLGFYVGSHDTPNAIGTNRDRYREAFSESQERLEDECKVLDVCPLCESEVQVTYDEEKNSVFHYCTGSDCIGQIPIYVVDRDIYRYVPSVLLGSLDKIVVSGMQPRFANLLGNYTSECPVHGYGYSGKCSEHAHCEHDDELTEVDPDDIYDPVPTLHLIDEVHLLNEELGTFASHYETLYLTLCKEIHGKTPKVLTSTATIAEYERQMRNLFQKDAVRFPIDGPKHRETFYGHLTETIQRQYGGFMPDNRSHLYAVLDTVEDYHEVIRDTRDLDSDDLAAETGIEDLTKDQQHELLDLYEMSIVYFTSKVDKDRYRENITKHTNAEMRKNGYEHRLVERQLTADTEDPSLLETLEDPEGIPFENRVDTVPSTSFIGHGIDVDRFNMMLFYGFPRQTFQYIQASSRVGRQSGVTGFVLDAFNPLDERDIHRYRFFEKMHEYLDRAVEPVPIDRWAKFGIERTFTGLANALLIQYYRPEMWRSETITVDAESERANVQKASHLYKLMTDTQYSTFTKDRFHEQLRRAYGLTADTTETRYFATQLESKLADLWRYWEQNLASMQYPEFPHGNEPMVNLRDIGDSGSITAQYNNQPFIEALLDESDAA